MPFCKLGLPDGKLVILFVRFHRAKYIKNKHIYTFAVFQTCPDFDLVHWVQEARVGSQGGRSGRDKQFLMPSYDKSLEIACYSTVV